MMPTQIGYDIQPLYDGIGELIGYRIVYGTREFAWSLSKSGTLTLVYVK